MRLENTMKRAEDVLKEVKRLLKRQENVKDSYGVLYPYQNGREHGYSIHVSNSSGDSRRVYFSENRNSDATVVYYTDKDTYNDMITDEAYENARYFEWGRDHEAAHFIAEYLTFQEEYTYPQKTEVVS